MTDEPIDTTIAEPTPTAETGNSEAAKYRRQLRETETARDALAAQLDASRRAQVDHLAEAARIKPAALWASGVTLDDLMTDGIVDAVKVTAAAEKATSALGLSRQPKPDPSIGVGAGKGMRDAWPAAFRPR
jgi:hypothetical protein